MTSKEIQKIDPTQYRIIAPYLDDYPVKLGKIAQALDVQILVSSLGSGISGQISKSRSNYVIRVNRNESREGSALRLRMSCLTISCTNILSTATQTALPIQCFIDQGLLSMWNMKQTGQPQRQ